MCKFHSSKTLNDEEFLALNVQRRIEYIDGLVAQSDCYVSEEDTLEITQTEASEILKTLIALDAEAAKTANTYEGVYVRNFRRLVNENFSKPHLAFNLAKRHFSYLSDKEEYYQNLIIMENGYCPTCGLYSKYCPCGTFEFSDDDLKQEDTESYTANLSEFENFDPAPDDPNALDHWPTPEEGGYEIQNEKMPLIGILTMNNDNKTHHLKQTRAPSVEKSEPFDKRFFLFGIMFVITLILVVIPLFITVRSPTMSIILWGAPIIPAFMGMIIGWPFLDEQIKMLVKQLWYDPNIKAPTISKNRKL